MVDDADNRRRVTRARAALCAGRLTRAGAIFAVRALLAGLAALELALVAVLAFRLFPRGSWSFALETEQ